MTYRSAIPEEQHVYDYVLLNLAPSKETNPTLVELWVQRALAMTHNVIVGVPSTELALADQLMQRYPVKCISKPLSRKKLLQTLAAQQPQLANTSLPKPQADKLPLCVMAVDDNPANLKLITALLQERAEYVVSCTSGQEAIEQAQSRQFDIILMDIQMPHMDGVTACKAIKQLKGYRDTPIIAVTAHAMAGERDRLLKAGWMIT